VDASGKRNGSNRGCRIVNLNIRQLKPTGRSVE